MEPRPKCLLNCITNTHEEVQRKHDIAWLVTGRSQQDWNQNPQILSISCTLPTLLAGDKLIREWVQKPVQKNITMTRKKGSLQQITKPIVENGTRGVFMKLCAAPHWCRWDVTCYGSNSQYIDFVV